MPPRMPTQISVSSRAWAGIGSAHARAHASASNDERMEWSPGTGTPCPQYADPPPPGPAGRRAAISGAQSFAYEGAQRGGLLLGRTQRSVGSLAGLGDPGVVPLD